MTTAAMMISREGRFAGQSMSSFVSPGALRVNAHHQSLSIGAQQQDHTKFRTAARMALSSMAERTAKSNSKAS